MPGHDQTDVRSRHRRAQAWLFVASGAALIALCTGETHGQSAPAAVWNGDEAASIQLRADTIQTWEDAGASWMILEDHAAIIQGDVSLSAHRMVAKVVRSGRANGSIHRVELYAAGEVQDPSQPGTSYPEIRTNLVTSGQIDPKSLRPGGLHRLKKPPKGLRILGRAFPKSDNEPAAAPTDPPGTGPTRGLPGLADEAALPENRAAADAIEPGSSSTITLMPTTTVQPSDPATPSTGPAPSPMTMPFGSAGGPPSADPAVRPTQATGSGPGFPDDFTTPPRADPPTTAEPLVQDPAVPMDPNAVPFGPGDDPVVVDPPTGLLPLPDGTLRSEPADPGPAARGADANVVVTPGSQRVIDIQPRGQTDIQSLKQAADGTQTILIRNGVNITTQTPEQGIIDLEADQVVIWIKGTKDNPAEIDFNNFNNQIITKKTQPIEFYLEGHVVVRQDQQRIQGKSDQRTYKANRAYYDLQKEQMLVLDAELELFAPGLITPVKTASPRIFQFHPTVPGPDGRPTLSTFSQISAERTTTTGSRFARPGYRFTSGSIDIKQVIDSQARPNESGLPYDQNDQTWLIDARQNFFYFGPVPVFYAPRFFVEADDLDPPLQGISIATNNYFGQQVRADFDIFNLLNQRHLPEIDVANLDVDYLSARDKSLGQGIALGTEVGWFGSDLLRDITDPFHRDKSKAPSAFGNYAGYFDAYGLFDGSRDVLGLGPAIITNGSNGNAAGRLGAPGGLFSRLSNPTYQNFRGRITARHMQSFTTKDTPLDEDFRVNFEVGFFSDRNFLEQYFKRLFDTGLDQENLIYAIRQKQNQTFTFLSEVNLQTFNTESQWLPKLDYYRLGDSLLNNRLTYYQHTGADYANVHTASEVANRTLFAFLPFDPISNTNRAFRSGRLYTSHELDLPLNFQFVRVTPYLQGQAVGWNNQINDHAVGRLWGAVGARADVTFWKVYPDAESELLNVHGLNHKIDLVADFRDAYSNVNLNSIGVQDDLDDNAYEYTRRYFALVNYGGGVLPAQYDPRFLMLRRAISPITGTTDIQATVETLKLGIHQRLQTKRGQEGRRHINDYMVFDVDTTFFPNAARDNFGKPFGQNFYNYEWYLGDRTSFVSYGWFEFFKIGGNPNTVNNNNLRNDPFGLRIITSGISITRIPKGNIFIGYTIVNTGPISTSALNTSYSYWLSPKWFGTAGSSYDFGNNVLLAATGSLTRIGADYLTSAGLTVSPLQHSYQFVFEISPRLSPNLRAGSSSGLTRLDSRFAPVE